jgi:hypothetical protein
VCSFHRDSKFLIVSSWHFVLRRLQDRLFFTERHQMTFKPWQRALCAISLAAAAAVPAQAVTVSFNTVTPGTIVLPGESVTEGGYTFTAFDGFGVVDTAAAFGPGTGLDLAGPTGNPGPFYIGLNDSYVQMRAVGGVGFTLQGFSFGFVSALTNLFNPGDVPGLLVAEYEKINGSTGSEFFSFGAADAAGKFSFRSVNAAGLGGLSGSLRFVDFYACTADGSGQCAAVNSNFSQFALDTINVPEPGSLALALAALALTAGFTRRKA